MNKCDFSHVVYKDLADYIRRDDYFLSYSNVEKTLVRENLGITVFKVTVNTYDRIANLVSKNALEPGLVYIINNFRSIYRTNDGRVFGPENSEYPSTLYHIVLTAISENLFSSDVKIVGVEESTWDVKFDITLEALTDDVLGYDCLTLGKITYLKDNKGNSAYYDFKNVRTYVKSEDNSKNYLLTFNGEAVNNTLPVDCKYVVFYNNATNNHFGYGTENVIFVGDITQCLGVISDITINTETAALPVTKTISKADDKYILVYLDSETLTLQTEIL